MNGPPPRSKFHPAPVVLPSAFLTTVPINDFALFMKNSFTYSGYLLAAWAMAILQPLCIDAAWVKFLAFSSNCASSCFKSGHQFSAQDNMTKNVGGPWPRATWCVIQCFRSSFLLHQKLSPPLMFLEKCLNMLMYLVFLLRSCCFSSCTVGGFSPMKRSELKKKLPSLLLVCRWIVLYKHKPNKLSSRNRPSKYRNKCCPHSLMGTSPLSMIYISPTPPGNNHGYELTKICFCMVMFTVKVD